MQPGVRARCHERPPKSSLLCRSDWRRWLSNAPRKANVGFSNSDQWAKLAGPFLDANRSFFPTLHPPFCQPRVRLRPRFCHSCKTYNSLAELQNAAPHPAAVFSPCTAVCDPFEQDDLAPCDCGARFLRTNSSPRVHRFVTTRSNNLTLHQGFKSHTVASLETAPPSHQPKVLVHRRPCKSQR